MGKLYNMLDSDTLFLKIVKERLERWLSPSQDI